MKKIEWRCLYKFLLYKISIIFRNMKKIESKQIFLKQNKIVSSIISIYALYKFKISEENRMRLFMQICIFKNMKKLN